MADFERMFSENHGLVYHYLTALCRNPSLAEELTQEAFFKAYMNLGQLRDESKASVWLCQIARNTYFAWYNEQKKLVEADETIPAAAPDPAEAFVRKELSREAFACLHELEEPYRKVFLLSVFAGLSLKEISALFSKSESWARVTFCRAKKKLREKLRERHEL